MAAIERAVLGIPQQALLIFCREHTCGRWLAINYPLERQLGLCACSAFPRFLLPQLCSIPALSHTHARARAHTCRARTHTHTHAHTHIHVLQIKDGVVAIYRQRANMAASLKDTDSIVQVCKVALGSGSHNRVAGCLQHCAFILHFLTVPRACAKSCT